MLSCALPGCVKSTMKICVCLREPYCSQECQLKDWKTHKIICKTLKRLSCKPQPYNKARVVINDILKSNGNNLKILQHLLSYADEQFGKERLKLGSRVRDVTIIKSWNVPELHVIKNDKIFATFDINQIQILNVTVELDITYAILKEISNNFDVSNYDCFSRSMFFLERSHKILEFWLSLHDSDTSISFGEYMTNCPERRLWLSDELCDVLESLIVNLGNMGQFEKADNYCSSFIRYASRLENKPEYMFRALCSYAEVRRGQTDYVSAVLFAERAYNLVAIVHNPVHPLVQEASGILISNLIFLHRFEDAERFSLVTYEYLQDIKNGINQDSEVVAKGAYNLADVFYRQKKNLNKAELLARESFRIRKCHAGNDIEGLMIGKVAAAMSSGLLANILTMEGKLGDETFQLWEFTLNSCITNEGPDSKNVRSVNYSKGLFHLALGGYHEANLLKNISSEEKEKQMSMSKKCFTESIRIQALIDQKSCTCDKQNSKSEDELCLDKVISEILINGFDKMTDSEFIHIVNSNSFFEKYI